MAVEASHYHLFSSPRRDFLKINNQLYDTPMDPGLVFNDSTVSAAVLPPFYDQSPGFNPFSDFSPNKYYVNKADSGLTHNHNNSNANPPPQSPRKRNIDSIQNEKSQFSSVAPDFNPHIHLYQSDIDLFVAEHTRKVRMELEDRRTKQSRILVSSIQQVMMTKLKEKDDEIQRIRKLNWFLQERMKSLYIENQIWRDLAQSNEATANSLRSNLEQVLAHISEVRQESGGDGGGGGEDAQSRCGGGEAEEEKSKCKKCGEREESVVLIPCRHLCLCAMCGSSLVGTCPVCDSPMTGSVHINLS